jgi:hypothetical protein
MLIDRSRPHHVINAIRPQLQRYCAFFLECVSLVYSDDPGSAAGNVIEDSFRYFEADAQALQAGGDGPA